ncbi:MAG: M48 family metalloprotease [Rhizobiales bacterium]|nr:M48 family metalloprotease [Hyphomicrobiales bacterium]
MLEEFLTGEAFAKRVAKCEQYAAAHPAAYRRRVIAMAWLGYWLVPVIMIILLAPPAYVFWEIFTGDWPMAKNVIYGALWGFYALGMVQMAHALFVPHHPVEGLDVTEADAPGLIEAIEDIRAKINAPALDRVILTDELNASAAQVPKRSFMRQTTNELIIGLPLLEALEQDELLAVIAHEFGHFSGEHGKDGFLVGRTMRAWDITLTTCHDYGGWTGLVPFTIAKWFVPRFMAYSFAMRRDDEFFADRTAVAAVGAEVTGRALIQVELAAAYAEDCKEQYLNERLSSACAPKEPLKDMYAALARATSDRKARGSMLLALHSEDDPLDTHPGLRARLDAIGFEPMVPAAVSRPAVRMLGGFADKVYAHFNVDMEEIFSDIWPTIHSSYVKDKELFEQLDLRAANEKLNLDDAIQRAQLSIGNALPDDQLRCFTDAVCWYPGEARALFAMGVFLTKDHDQRGLEFLDRAASLDETASNAALQLAAGLAAIADDGEAVVAYRQKAEDWCKANDERIGKLHNPVPGGRLKPYQSSDDVTGFIKAASANSYMLERAYLVTKQMPEWFDDQDLLIVEPRLYGRMLSADEICHNVYMEAMEAGLSPAFRVWPLEKSEDWLREQLAAMPDALIWSRGDQVENTADRAEAINAEVA